MNDDTSDIKNNSFQFFCSNQTNVIQLLKNWCGLKDYSIIYDSDINNICKEYLTQTFLHKKNMIFIHFDDNNNVFGGYIHSEITCTNKWICDSNSFVFSLFRNGSLRNGHYPIKTSEKKYAFYAQEGWDESFSMFVPNFYYEIGRGDIYVENTHHKGSFCNPVSYSLNKFTLSDGPSSRCYIHRIIILQMK
ncbi:TLDc domain-containing protein [Entamoeba marina]